MVGDPKVDPAAAANPAADISEKRLIELLRIGVGDPAIPVKIDGVARWRATSDIARRYQRRIARSPSKKSDRGRAGNGSEQVTATNNTTAWPGFRSSI